MSLQFDFLTQIMVVNWKLGLRFLAAELFASTVLAASSYRMKSLNDKHPISTS